MTRVERRRTFTISRRPGGIRSRPAAALLLACALAATACSRSPQAAAQTSQPVEVSVVRVESQHVPLRRELPGRLNAQRVAEVRARVSGILLERSFEEGSDVEKGQVLFRIDPAPLRARVDGKRAALARARANLTQVENRAERYASLVEISAVSQQEFDDTQALKQQREAEVLAAAAELRSAELDLGYATVRAPISGRIGKALVTEGALVGEGEATRLAVIQQLDPLYFDFEQSSAELLSLRRQLEQGTLVHDERAAAPKVTLLLDGNHAYPHPGMLLFSEATVHPATGMVLMRAEVANPDHLLLPGMFARARIDQAVQLNALTVPQRAVALEQDGRASVWVVDEHYKVERRAVRTGRALGTRWIVSEGLRAGDQVIVEGRQKVREGSVVRVVEAKQES